MKIGKKINREEARRMVEFALNFSTEYNRQNPIRTADVHPKECDCMRCFADFCEAVAAKGIGLDR